jgi:uncharacterized protein (TIGR02145 family)
MKTIFQSAGLLLLINLIFTFSCGKKDLNNPTPSSTSGTGTTTNNPPGNPTSLTDARDGNTYNAVTINDQVWMADNLNYAGTLAIGSSNCTSNAPGQCKKFGRLYTGDAAKIACPAGWHLPTDAEWRKMEHFLGMTDADTSKLGTSNRRGVKELVGLKLKNGGSSGFNVAYVNNKDITGYWTSTMNGSNQYYRLFDPSDDSSVFRNVNPITASYCVRCVMD